MTTVSRSTHRAAANTDEVALPSIARTMPGITHGCRYPLSSIDASARRRRHIKLMSRPDHAVIGSPKYHPASAGWAAGSGTARHQFNNHPRRYLSGVRRSPGQHGRVDNGRRRRIADESPHKLYRREALILEDVHVSGSRCHNCTQDQRALKRIATSHIVNDFSVARTFTLSSRGRKAWLKRRCRWRLHQAE